MFAKLHYKLKWLQIKVKKWDKQKKESAEIKILGPILTELSVKLHPIKFSGKISSYIWFDEETNRKL